MKIVRLLPLGVFLVASSPLASAADTESGPISFYSSKYNGRKTACQEIFSNSKMTAAHKTLPCGTKLKVTANDKSVNVTVNDRGPFVKGRNLSITKAAARELGFTKSGTVQAKWEVVK